MFDVKQYTFICLFYFGVIWDRRINMPFTPLCQLKWRSLCNQNSLNALWMLGSDFCAWVQTWLIGDMCWGLKELQVLLEKHAHYKYYLLCDMFSSVQSLSHVRLFETPWTAARQVSKSPKLKTNHVSISGEWINKTLHTHCREIKRNKNWSCIYMSGP